MFREMRCSRVENRFVLPLVGKGQGLITMISHKAYSERQGGKVATSEITGLRAGTTLMGILVLPWLSGREVGLMSETHRS